MTRLTRWILAFTIAIGLLAALVYTNHELGRPDRIKAAALEVELKAVRDQIVRYEYDTGRAPESLDVLVPTYIREDQIYNENGARYDYNAAERTVSEKHGPVVTGLISYQMHPRQLNVERPELPSTERESLVPVVHKPAPPVIPAPPAKPPEDPV